MSVCVNVCSSQFSGPPSVPCRAQGDQLTLVEHVEDALLGLAKSGSATFVQIGVLSQEVCRRLGDGWERLRLVSSGRTGVQRMCCTQVCALTLLTLCHLCKSSLIEGVPDGVLVEFLVGT